MTTLQRKDKNDPIALRFGKSSYNALFVNRNPQVLEAVKKALKAAAAMADDEPEEELEDPDFI